MESTAALRSVTIADNRFCLNDRLVADTTEDGSALGVDGSSWGYDRVRTADELVQRCRGSGP